MMHASHATNSLRPSLCTTNLRHIHFPHTVSPRPPTPTLLRCALIRAHTCALSCSLLSVISPFPRLTVFHVWRTTVRCTRYLARPLATCSTTSLHSPTRSPTRYVLDDVTALAHSLTHSLRARRRHCTRPLAHPRATCSKTSLHSPTRSPHAACSKTSLHSPTRSPTH
jgi:hypothetical protein